MPHTVWQLSLAIVIFSTFYKKTELALWTTHEQTDIPRLRKVSCATVQRF